MILYLPMSTTEIAAVCVAVVSFLGAACTAFIAFRNNSSGMKNDIIKTYETRMEQLEADVEKLTTKVDELKILLEKSEADRMKAESILQGRNPELDKYMTLTLQLLTDIHGAVMPQTVAKT